MLLQATLLLVLCLYIENVLAYKAGGAVSRLLEYM